MFRSTNIMMLQTADGSAYADMLAVGRKANESYATAQGLGYQCFIGIKRGYFPWHAAFNKVLLTREIMAAGYRGWVFYLDADAFVYDQEFDLVRYLKSHHDKALIAGPGGAGGERWDINVGVFLVNLRMKSARQLIEHWYSDVMGTTDDQLRQAPAWYDVMSDQPRLHRILQENPHYQDDLHIAERSFFNDYKASFVRQIFRSPDLSMADRIAMMKADIALTKAKYTTARQFYLPHFFRRLRVKRG